MTKTMTAADTKAHFSDCVRLAESGHSVVITRHGRPVAALVAADGLRQLERLRAARPRAGLAGLAGGWDRTEELVRLLRRSRRTRSRAVRSVDD